MNNLKFKFKVTQIYTSYIDVQAESYDGALDVLEELKKTKDSMTSNDDLEDTLFDLVGVEVIK